MWIFIIITGSASSSVFPSLNFIFSSILTWSRSFPSVMRLLLFLGLCKRVSFMHTAGIEPTYALDNHRTRLVVLANRMSCAINEDLLLSHRFILDDYEWRRPELHRVSGLANRKVLCVIPQSSRPIFLTVLVFQFLLCSFKRSDTFHSSCHYV